jgi:uncharacterized protein with HEPN domain
MRRDPAAFLWDVREAASRIQEFVVGLDFAAFSSDALVRSAVERQFSAVERQFEIIGEALNQLFRVAPALVVQIPEAPRIIAFRNILIHGYAVLDQRIVWRVIQEHLPPLAAAAERLLKSSPLPSAQ